MNALVPCHRRSFAALLLFVCVHATAWGQPKAAFTATPRTGCSPLVVYFSDSSTGNPAQWKWDLGNGVTSFQKSPSATYFNPGTYTVTLVVSNAAGKDSAVKSQYITVYENPAPDFSFDKATGCFPLQVNFTDKSAPGTGSIVAWQWDFGDGIISTQQSPSHVYTAAGAFNVTLRVTNTMGCVKSFTIPQAIAIADGVKAGFSSSDPGICPAPASAQFTNLSTGPAPLQYQWSFGDGATSTAANPSHLYSTNGTFTVQLVATSSMGCVDTFTKQDVFQIGSAKADFNAPQSVCVNSSVQFTTTSSPAPASVQWDFGDGTTSTALNPIKTFTQAGLYTVRQICNFGACLDTVKKLLTVADKPSANFTATQQPACKLPVMLQFTALASGPALTYTWDFGDGTKATTSNPVHAYTTEGTFTVKLIVTNAGGCSDTLVKTNAVLVQVPHVLLSGLPRTGCLPLTVTPAASVSGGETIGSYLWNFGDGTTSTLSNPSHTYTQAGNYTVSLVATYSSGCIDTVTFTNAVRLGEKPRANFVYTPTYVCPYEKVFFTDKSTGSIDQWFWSFGDGGTSTEQNPNHQYADTGWHNVTLIVYNNTCPDTLLLKNAVHVNPPISRFAVKQTCSDKFTKTFVDNSLAPETWAWDFGDGTSSTAQNPVHVYSSTGSYKVKLTVTNGSCSHTSETNVMVINEKAAFTPTDTVVCRNSNIVFASAGINSGVVANWTWSFGDGATSAEAPATSHTFANAGTYTVSLSITDLLSCKSTQTTQVRVYGPTAAFKPSVAATCLQNNNVVFTDASSSDGQHPITNWIWNYGDTVLDTLKAAPFQHRYTQSGTYTVGLTVVDDYGCSDSSKQPAAVVIAQPVAAFTASDTITCTGKSIAFTNASAALSPSYSWSFGDGKTTTTASPVHTYGATGLYTVILLVTDQYGCKDSVVKTDWINVSYPKAKFSLSDSTGTCPPLLVQFTNESSDYSRIYWDFGDGNNSALDTPSHFYAAPGTFYAKLIATGPGGCTDTVQRKIVVKGPTGTFRYAPLSGCMPLKVNFTATTKNNASFIWDFSDGTTTASKDTTIAYTYLTAGDFVPKMILTDAGGCSVPVTGTDTIRVKSVSTAFTMSATAFCNDGVVQFNNQTVSNDYITGYYWKFGDSTTSTTANPLHRYQAPGVYTVQLLATTQNGCFDQQVLTDTVRVYANPIVEIKGDSASCAPANFTFNGLVQQGNASLLQWSWDMANGNASALQDPLPQKYATDGLYTIKTIVTDEHGCKDTAQKSVSVYPLPTTNAGSDQWICRGSFQQLTATGAETYQWQAASSLSCTDCDSPLAAPADSTQFVVTGFNRFGCSTTDSVIIRVHQPFTLTVEKGDTVCAGATIRLAAAGADNYTWTPSADVKNAAAGSTTAVPKTSTLYRVVAKDNVNCFTDTGSVYIKVWPIPVVTVQAAQTLSIGNTLTLKPNYSADVTSIQWSNAQTLSCATCPAPVAKPKTETTYTVAVKNDGGCTAKTEVTVHVICNGGNFFLPNTFSPNADGRNDRFYPRGTGISSIKSLKVYNRWGEVVFSREAFTANDASAGWDGSFKGQQLSPDVYIYTCEVICMNNEVLTFTGDVTLLK